MDDPFISEVRERGFAIVREAINQPQILALLSSLGDEPFSGLREAHVTSPTVRAFVEDRAIRRLVEPILGEEARCVRSIFFDKNPQRNWSVPWHQDLTIAVREKREAPGFVGWSIKEGVHHVQAPREILEQILTVRVHLDDADETNGALVVLPGSHCEGWLNSERVEDFKSQVQAIRCAARAGDALLMRPLLLHSSERAHTPVHRRVLHLEFSAAKLPHGLEWRS